MNSPLIMLVASFLVLLLLNVPVAVSICLATFLTALLVMGSFEIAAQTIAQQIATGIDSFALLAIPFFILSGLLMGHGGIARRLMDFANALVGRFTGGLGYVNVLTCMFFGAISGSATAAVSSVGGFMIPEMNRKGYNRDFNVAVTTAAATTGLLIPPSNVMIVYALVMGGTVSIATMFIAGILPGMIFGLALMLASGLVSWKRGYGAGDPVPMSHIWSTFRRSVLSLLLVVIVLGGILKGIFTATEAAAISVAYAFLLSVVVYKEIRLGALPQILLQCGVTTAVVFLLIATSMAMSWILTLEEIPQRVSATMMSISSNPIVVLLLINVLLLVVGTFMDMTPAILIFTPIFWPVVKQFGMDPVHFGVMLVANLCIGLCTPPVGTCLFVGCGVGKTSIASVSRALLPFFVALLGALLLISFVPGITLLLPKFFGMK